MVYRENQLCSKGETTKMIVSGWTRGLHPGSCKKKWLVACLPNIEGSLSLISVMKNNDEREGRKQEDFCT